MLFQHNSVINTSNSIRHKVSPGLLQTRTKNKYIIKDEMLTNIKNQLLTYDTHGGLQSTPGIIINYSRSSSSFRTLQRMLLQITPVNTNKFWRSCGVGINEVYCNQLIQADRPRYARLTTYTRACGPRLYSNIKLYANSPHSLVHL